MFVFFVDPTGIYVAAFGICVAELIMSLIVKAGFCEFGDGGSGAGFGQTLLLVHIVWLVLPGFSVLFGFL